MLIKVEHTTSFAYAARISEAYTELRVRPLSAGGQHCTSFRLVTDPPGVRVRNYRDRLGNHVQHLEVLEDHDRISISAFSEVSTPAVFSEPARDSPPLQGYDYLAPTGYAPFSDALLELGRGVCQDFAHVMLAACRRAGISSRYVSGYLYDPLGAGEVASHAWVDILDSDRGWVSLDPTHDREQTAAYVRVAVGRDYADVPPTRGVYKGTAEETLEVAVRIAVM